MWERGVFGDVLEEHLPLDLESVVEDLVVRYINPVLAELEGVFDVGIPHGFGGVDAVLRSALAQAGDGASQRAIHLNAEEFVAVDPEGPRGVDLRDDAAVELERPVCGVVGGGFVAHALLVDALRNGCATETLHGLDAAERMVEDVAPVAEHVDDDAAVVLLAIVPG